MRLKANPHSADFSILDGRIVGAAYQGVVSSVGSHATARTLVRRSPADLERIEVSSVSTVDDTTLQVEYCLITDAIVYSTETDAVVDDSVVSFSVSGVMVAGRSGWALANSRTSAQFEGAGCS